MIGSDGPRTGAQAHRIGPPHRSENAVSQTPPKRARRMAGLSERRTRLADKGRASTQETPALPVEGAKQVTRPFRSQLLLVWWILNSISRVTPSCDGRRGARTGSSVKASRKRYSSTGARGATSYGCGLGRRCESNAHRLRGAVRRSRDAVCPLRPSLLGCRRSPTCLRGAGGFGKCG